MRFSLSGDRVAFRDAVRDLLAGSCPPDVVREAWSERAPRADAVWDRLAAMGLFGAMVPESTGGLGLDEIDLVPVLMEIGYAAVPHPVAETTAVAAPLLAACGDHRLAGVIAGKTRVALGGPGGLVPYGRAADLVLVLDGETARLVLPASSTVEETVDGALGLTRVTLRAGGVLGHDPDLVALARQRADLATAAQLVGLGRRMLDLTTAYVTTRHQFGVPVGSFQAVKHHLADALLGLEFAAPAALAAGWELANGTTAAPRAVAMAAVLAVDAATGTAKTAIQCHGAIGYTVEYDLHLYAKRAWALAATVDVDEHLNRLADELELGGDA